MIPRNRAFERAIGLAFFYIIAAFLAALVCLPFFWMISTSLKNRGTLMSIPIQWLPENPSLDSYTKLFGIRGFGTSILNSFYLSITCTLARLLCAAMAAYALAKTHFKGRERLFKLYITALMVPVQITFIPLFIIMTRLNLVNNLNAFILLQFFNAFAIFMLYQQMKTIHDSYIEAASIDGASHWQIFLRIVLPFCSGTLATLAILSFMDVWNDYLLPLVLLSDRSKFTLTVILSSLSTQYNNQYNLIMAGSLVSIIPILIVYIAMQKYFKGGLAVGGIKG
jgi:multiple sugar transport system permease protein